MKKDQFKQFKISIAFICSYILSLIYLIKKYSNFSFTNKFFSKFFQSVVFLEEHTLGPVILRNVNFSRKIGKLISLQREIYPVKKALVFLRLTNFFQRRAHSPYNSRS